MCLIIFEWQPENNARFSLAANRDEFYARATQQAQFWNDHPEIYGGRDLEMGGTWLGVSRRGRLAAITNFRYPDDRKYPRSRGEIPTDFLLSDASAQTFAQALQATEQNYAGYNALFFDGQQLVYTSNRDVTSPRVLPAGQYALSNHLLDTPWPKALNMRSSFQQIQKTYPAGQARDEALLEALTDRTPAPDDDLPDTGIGLQSERLLSAIFIHSPAYGTRCSSLVTMESGHSTHFVERSYDELGNIIATTVAEVEANYQNIQLSGGVSSEP